MNESELAASIEKFFGVEPRKVPPEIRLLQAQLLALAELKKRGFQVSSARNLGTNRTPTFILGNEVKVEVRARNLDTPTELDDFSVKKNAARRADVFLCHDPLANCFHIFQRRELGALWLDGDLYYSQDCLYFYPWEKKEDAEKFVGKTKKGRDRTWGNIFKNKDRILAWADAVIGAGLQNFRDKWEKVKTAQPAEPDKKEETHKFDEVEA